VRNESHVGSLDVDLDLDVELLAEGRYAELVKTLEDVGYERGAEGMKPFQLRRTVSVDEGKPVAVLVDLLMPRNAEPKKNRPKLLDDFRVQGCDGADVALSSSTLVAIEGRMPDSRPNTVELRVATVPAMLAMKGYAVVGRDKKKDAYDIWYSIRNYPDGPAALAKACGALLGNPSAKQGFELIASKFQERDAFGPATVRAFLAPMAQSSLAGGMTLDQIQTDAFQQVQALLKALGIAAGGRAAP